MDETVDLSVITVTYQSRDYIDGCIMSVVGHTFRPYEHFIVDNHSTDGTVELIETSYLNYVTLIKNTKNLGFAAANNQAAQIARGRYLLFLNPDMQIQEGSLDSLVEWMDSRPDVGLATCKLISPDPRLNSMLHPKRFSSPGRHIFYLLTLMLPRSKIFPVYENFDANREQEIDHARGAFLIIRKEIVDQLGFAFDPAYFLTFEDVDLCHEVKRLGYKVMYTPQVTCLDYFSRSFAQTTTAWRFVTFAKAYKTFVCKWHSPLHTLWITPAIALGFLLRIPKWGLKSALQALKK